MIPEAHAHFLRWAQWVKAPVGGVNLGYGPSILVRIIEGKGLLLPGGGGVAGALDPVGAQVQRFVDKLARGDRLMVRVFYLDKIKTVEERAERLRMPVRTLYDRLDRIHALYLVVSQQWSE